MQAQHRLEEDPVPTFDRFMTARQATHAHKPERVPSRAGFACIRRTFLYLFRATSGAL